MLSAMRHSTKLLTPAEALYRAIRPIQSQNRWISYRRERTESYGRQQQEVFRPPPRPQKPQLDPQMAKRLQSFTLNENIKTPMVQVRQENGRLEVPERLTDILRGIDFTTHVVRQLAPQGPVEGVPIVEVASIGSLLDSLELKENQLKALEKQRRTEKPKQLELNWAISENDFAMKLKQLEQFLDKGRKVEIILANKKRQRRATPDEAQNVVKVIRERVTEIGARELKMEGNILGQAVMTIQKKS
jgi:translation initiation factor IF-3